MCLTDQITLLTTPQGISQKEKAFLLLLWFILSDDLGREIQSKIPILAMQGNEGVVMFLRSE